MLISFFWGCAGTGMGAGEGARPLTAGELVLCCHRALHHLGLDEARAQPVGVRGVMLGGDSGLSPRGRGEGLGGH